ncbi:Transcription-repair coupling factor, partial [hydrothermal vent metagenome]
QLDICGLHGGSAALFLARVVAAHHRSVCCIVPADEQLEILAQDLRLFSAAEVLVYPSFEIPPYTPMSPDPATIALRLATLHRLLNNTEPCIVLSSAEAVLRRLPPRRALGRHSELVMAGEETDREALIRSLTDAGYQICSMVQHEGDLAVRGGIIDIYTPSPDPAVQGPLRLDFFGDTIDSIRLFDPVSQRSTAELEEAVLLPATDILFPAPVQDQAWRDFLKKTAAALGWPRDRADHLLMQLGEHIRFAGIEFFLPLLFPEPDPVQTLFDYLPADSIMVFDDPAAVTQQVNLLRDRIMANYDEALQKDAVVLPPPHLFLDQQELDRLAARFPVLNLRPLPDPDGANETVTLT